MGYELLVINIFGLGVTRDLIWLFSKQTNAVAKIEQYLVS